MKAAKVITRKARKKHKVKGGKITVVKGTKGPTFRYFDGKKFAKMPKKRPKHISPTDWKLLRKKFKIKDVKTKGKVKKAKTKSQKFKTSLYPDKPRDRQDYLSTHVSWYIKLERSRIVDSDEDVMIHSGGLTLDGFYSKRTIISRTHYDTEVRSALNVLRNQEGWFLTEDMGVYEVTNKTKKRNGRFALVDVDSWRPIQDL